MFNLRTLFIFDDETDEPIETKENTRFFFIDALLTISDRVCGYYTEENISDWYESIYDRVILIDWYNEGATIEDMIIDLWNMFLDDMGVNSYTDSARICMDAINEVIEEYLSEHTCVEY